jgi:hypothetical protein
MLVDLKPRIARPTWPYVVDASHPLAQSLVCLYVFDPIHCMGKLIDFSPQKLAGDIPASYPTGANACSPKCARLGRAVNGVNWPLNTWQSPLSPTINKTFSVACLHAWDSGVTTNQYNALINTAYTDGFYLGKHAGVDQYSFYINTGFMQSAASTLTRDWTPRMVVATSDGAGNGAIYVQGQGVATSSSMSTAALTSRAVTIGSELFTNGNFYGDMYLSAVWNRTLTAGEAAWLQAEPYCMLQSTLRRTHLWSVAAGGGGGAPRLYTIVSPLRW